MVSFSSVLVILCVSLVFVDSINPKPVMELLQQQISKKANADCSTCNKPNQYCDFRSWSSFCKACPVCGIDHFCDGHGICQRCPGLYLKPDQACERVDANDPKSEGTYVVGKAVKLAFSTVGDDLFYLSAEPNSTATPDAVVLVVPPPPSPPGNATVPGNGTEPQAPAPQPTEHGEAVGATLSVTPSSHIIEEITAGSGQYRVSFNDSLGGYLRIILPPATVDEDVTALIDLKTMGVAQIFRDFAEFTTFGVEHAASFSWRFRVGNDENAKYLAWCGESTCGNGVPALRLVSSMFCGSLTTSGIRCDVMITN